MLATNTLLDCLPHCVYVDNLMYFVNVIKEEQNQNKVLLEYPVIDIKFYKYNKKHIKKHCRNTTPYSIVPFDVFD